MTQIIAGALILILGLTLESITSWRAIRGSRKYHPVLWQHSGQPTVMGNSDLTRAWPLVKYYRNRLYLKEIRHEGETFPAITDPSALDFAERLRAPLVYTYYFAWLCAPVTLFLIATAPD